MIINEKGKSESPNRNINEAPLSEDVLFQPIDGSGSGINYGMSEPDNTVLNSNIRNLAMMGLLVVIYLILKTVKER